MAYTSPKYLAVSNQGGLPTSEGATGRVAGSGLSTGHPRRRYDFSDRFTELAVNQTPFFRLVSQIGKQPTDDPQFKYTEKRGSWHKRYAYVVGFHNGSAAVINEAILANTSDSTSVSVGDTMTVYLAGDYLTAGNIQNKIGQEVDAHIGASGTRPNFVVPGMLLKVNVSDSATDQAAKDYYILRVTSQAAQDTDIDLGSVGDGVDNAETIKAVCSVVRVPSSPAPAAAYSTNHNTATTVDSTGSVTTSDTLAGHFESRRTYAVGSAHAEGSGLIGEVWNDNPYSTSYGQTQIFRSEFGMTNTARATALKYEPNEWARIWKDKLIEHKWDIEQAALFSTQYSPTASTSSVNTTQGAIDFVLNTGNIFSLTESTKTSDDFLDDMSQFLDPRYNNANATLFFCDTSTYNWLHKLSGYFSNSLELSPNFSSNFAAQGRGSMFGVDFTRISTVYGDMNVVRNIHLDGSVVKMLAMNMKYVGYRPLVGNGMNRDTAVYVGVSSLENSGDDKRVDMILTEAGFEFKMPEAHAIWK